jgi:flagellar hook assembly protein FlgD
MKGRCLRTLVNNDLSAGKHSFVWNAKTDNGTSVAGGLYLYRLDTGNRSVVRKTAYLR